MKFVSTHNNLLDGLSRVSSLAGRNPQLPILQNILLEVKEGVLNLTCTDLEVGAHVIVTGKAEGEGRVTVSAKQFLDFIQQLPTNNPITIEVKQKKLSITTPGYNAHIPISGADDFPLLPLPKSSSKIKLDSRLFCQALSGVIFAAARDDTRPEIHSLFIKGEEKQLKIVATDSFRLSERIIPLEKSNNFSFLLPLSAAQEISRLFGGVDEVNLLTEENYVAFQSEGYNLTTRIIDGNYPDYQQIIPKKFSTNGLVDREETIRALKVLSVFIPRESRRISIEVLPKKEIIKMQVDGGESGDGEVEVAWEGDGEEIRLLFNIQYLLDGVQHLNGKKCQLSLSGESDPLLIKPHEDNYHQLYVVMPIQN